MESKYTKDYLTERLDKMLFLYEKYNDIYKEAIESCQEDSGDRYYWYGYAYNNGIIDSNIILYQKIKLNFLNIPITYDLLLYIFEQVTASYEGSNMRWGFYFTDENGDFLDCDEANREEVRIAFSK